MSKGSTHAHGCEQGLCQRGGFLYMLDIMGIFRWGWQVILAFRISARPKIGRSVLFSVCGSGGTSTGTSTGFGWHLDGGLWFGWHLDGGSVVRVAPRRGSVVRVAPRRHLDGSTSTGSVVRVAPRRGLWFGWHLDGAPRRHLDGFGWHLDGTSTGTSTAPRRRLDGARTSLTSASTVLPSSLSAVLPESNRMAEGSFTTIRPRSIETSTWPLSIIAWNCSSPQGRVRAQLRGQLRQRGAGDAVETTPPSSGLGPSYYRSRPAHGMWHARC